MTRRGTGAQRTGRSGPLGPFADDYVARLRASGYAARSVTSALRDLGRLSQWLEGRRLSAADLSKERLEEFLAQLPRRRGGGSPCSGRALGQVLEVLGEADEGSCRAGKGPASPSEVLLGSFERFLLQERALGSSTASAYVARVRRFLVRCAPNGGLDKVTAREVTGAVLQASASASANTTKLFVTALRSFLRFSFLEGLTPVDLSPAAVAVAPRHRSSLPMGVDQKTARALLRSCDRRQPKGRRDYAVLLTHQQRLGLRAGEVASLRLEDIGWRGGEVVVHGKGRHEDRLPLPADVGGAVAAYLERGRQNGTVHREVFLRALAPIGPLGAGGISAIVRHACAAAGVPAVGAHRLRHSLACQLANAGVPLPAIAQVLRHRDIRTTTGYARVDIEGLRAVAQPWPGGEGQ